MADRVPDLCYVTTPPHPTPLLPFSLTSTPQPNPPKPTHSSKKSKHYHTMTAGPAGIIASAPRAGGVYSTQTPVSNNTTRYTSTTYGAPPASYGTTTYGAGSYPAAPARSYATNTYGAPAPTNYANAYSFNAGSNVATGTAAAGSYATSAYQYDVQRGRQQEASYDSSYSYNARQGRASSSHVGTARRTKTPLGNRYGYEAPDTANTYGAANAYGTVNTSRAATPGRLRAPLTSNPPPAQWGVGRMPSNKVTLVLDLDETLVHSCFEPCEADLHIPLVMDGEHYVAYVKKRPYMERFLARCVELFDVVVWTASLAVYAEPLINELCRLSRCGSVKQMYRESCTQLGDGSYVKDLSTMGINLDDLCILDNSPSVAQLQPKNLIPIVSWYDDPRDTALRDLIPHLDRLANCRSVGDVIPSLPRGGATGW